MRCGLLDGADAIFAEGVDRVKSSAGRIELWGIGALLLAALVLPHAAFAQTAVAPASAVPASSGIKVGYVDMQRLIDNSPQYVDALVRLKREFTSRDEAIKADDAKLATLKQHYERDNAIMTKEDADALKRELEASERANKRLKDDNRAEYNARATAENNRAFKAIQDGLIEFGRTQGYDLIVIGPVVYASPRVDVTDAILQRLKQSQTPAPGSNSGAIKP
jgi:outer membrane protein